MKQFIDAGSLNQRATILQIQEVHPRVWNWVSVRNTWMAIDEKTIKNLFSSVGVGARGCELILRQQTLDCFYAIRYRDMHLLLTAVTPHGRGHLQVSAAKVHPLQCTAQREKDGLGKNNRPITRKYKIATFPGILTDKYAGYQRLSTHAETTQTYVLVTPKQIVLEAGNILSFSAGPLHKSIGEITDVHLLEQYKNEYEFVIRKDV